MEDHLPASITQGASNLHSDDDMEDKIKLLNPRVQRLIRTYLEVRVGEGGRGLEEGVRGLGEGWARVGEGWQTIGLLKLGWGCWEGRG